VRDAAGALVTGNLALRTPAGRVGLPTLGTFPDDSPLTQTAPLPIPLENGNNRKFAYAPSTAIPNGTITNGGGVNAGEAVAAAPLEKEPAR
jgi:hypothetical protein